MNETNPTNSKWKVGSSSIFSGNEPIVGLCKKMIPARDPQTALKRTSLTKASDKNLYKIFIPGPLREPHKVVKEGLTRSFARTSLEHLTTAFIQAPLASNLENLHGKTSERISTGGPDLYKI